MAQSSCTSAQTRALLLGCLCIFAMGGLVFGISSIFPNLYDEDAFEGVCDARHLCPHDGTACCNEQLQILSLFSSIGFFVADGAAAPWGEIVDRCGSRACLFCAALMSIIALLFLGSGSAIDEAVENNGWRGSLGADTLTSIGLVLAGAAGPGVFNGVYTGCLGLPEPRTPFYEAILATLVAGSFDLSSLVFNLFSSASALVPLSVGFFGWAVVAAILVTLTLIYAIPSTVPAPSPAGEMEAALPAKPTEETGLLKGPSPPAVEEKQPDPTSGKSYGSSLLSYITGSSKPNEESAIAQKEQALLQQKEEPAAEKQKTSGPHGWLETTWESVLLPVYHVICTPHNLLLVTLMSVLNLSCSHYLVSRAAYLRLQHDGETSTSISDAFDICFPVLGFCAAIAVSPILTAKAWVPFAVLAVAANLWLILITIPSVATQWMSVAVFGPMRTLQWAWSVPLPQHTPPSNKYPLNRPAPVPIVSCAQLLPHNRRDARAVRARQHWARAGLQWPHHRDLRRRALTTIVELRPARRNRRVAGEKLYDHQDRAAVHPAARLDRVAFVLTVDPCPRSFDWRHNMRGPPNNEQTNVASISPPAHSPQPVGDGVGYRRPYVPYLS